MPLILLVLFVVLNFVVYGFLKLAVSWEKAEVRYKLKDAYNEGRKKQIIGL
jgi:hypothetical protein